MINLEGFVRKHTDIEIGGRQFTFSQLTLGDFAQFRAFVVKDRKKFNEERREQLFKDAERIEGIKPLELLERLERPPTDEEVEAEMESVDGMAYLAYLSLKYAYPEITLDNVKEIIPLSGLEQIAKAVVGDMEGGEKKELPPQPEINQ